MTDILISQSLKIKTSCFLLVIPYFLIHAVIAQIFVPTAEHAITAGKLIKEPKTEMEMRPLTAKAKVSK